MTGWTWLTDINQHSRPNRGDPSSQPRTDGSRLCGTHKGGGCGGVGGGAALQLSGQEMALLSVQSGASVRDHLSPGTHRQSPGSPGLFAHRPRNLPWYKPGLCWVSAPRELGTPGTSSLLQGCQSGLGEGGQTLRAGLVVPKPGGQSWVSCPHTPWLRLRKENTGGLFPKWGSGWPREVSEEVMNMQSGCSPAAAEAGRERGARAGSKLAPRRRRARRGGR